MVSVRNLSHWIWVAIHNCRFIYAYVSTLGNGAFLPIVIICITMQKTMLIMCITNLFMQSLYHFYTIFIAFLTPGLQFQVAAPWSVGLSKSSAVRSWSRSGGPMLHSWSWSQTGCDRTRPSPRIDPYWQRMVFCKWGNGLIGNGMSWAKMVNPCSSMGPW